MKHIIALLAGKRAWRAFPGRRAVLGPWLQHRIADGRPYRGSVAVTHDHPVTTGSDDVIEQITKHLNRLIEVVKVVDLTEGKRTLERELMLVKVRAVGKEREEMKRTADIFRGRIIDVTDKTYTIELTGTSRSKTRCLPRCHRTAACHPGDRTYRRQRYWPRRAHPARLSF